MYVSLCRLCLLQLAQGSTPIWDNMHSLNCILPHNYSSRFYPTSLPVYTHNVSKTMLVFFHSIPPVGANAAGCLGWNRSPCGDSRVYLTVWCGVAEVTFVGIRTWVCIYVCSSMSMCECKSQSVLVTAGLYVTLQYYNFYDRVTLGYMNQSVSQCLSQDSSS